MQSTLFHKHLGIMLTWATTIIPKASDHQRGLVYETEPPRNVVLEVGESPYAHFTWTNTERSGIVHTHTTNQTSHFVLKKSTTDILSETNNKM